jgi:formylglycine-generating enzyme required for sulfatase activity
MTRSKRSESDSTMLTRLGRSLILAALLLQGGIAHGAIRLRLNELASSASSEAAALRQLKQEVEKQTHGEVRIDLHFDGALGDASTSLENMISGELDLFSGNFEIFLPLLVDEVSGFELPFMIPGNAVASRYIASPFMEEGRARDLTLRHIRFLELDAYRGPSRVIASHGPIASVSALAGLRLAIVPAPSKPEMKVWQGLGVSLAELDPKAAALAFRQHNVDAVILPGPADPVASDVLRTAHYAGPIEDRPQLWQISIHEATWQKLTQAQQAVLAKAAEQSAATYRQLQEKQFKALAGKFGQGRFGQGISIDALAAHQQLQPVYEGLIKIGGTTEKVTDAASQALGTTARAALPKSQAYPVGVGQEFRDCPDCPLMVVVPAGEFTMGSPSTERGRFDTEGPQHRVLVSHPFAIAKYPTTVREAKLWRGEDPAQDDIDDDPAVMLNWFDGVAYAEWLSKKTGHHYHLPTEAQFEYAERGGTTTPYYWGETIGINHANCYGCQGHWDGRGSAPVGSFAANPFGLYDMTGNIFEWLADCFADTEDSIPADAFIPHQNRDGSCGLRAVKGTSWFNLPSFLRSAYRYGDRPDRRNNRKGFRMVRD